MTRASRNVNATAATLIVEPPEDIGKWDVWPGCAAAFIRCHPHADVGDEVEPKHEALTGLFGLIPH